MPQDPKDTSSSNEWKPSIEVDFEYANRAASAEEEQKRRETDFVIGGSESVRVELPARNRYLQQFAESVGKAYVGAIDQVTNLEIKGLNFLTEAVLDSPAIPKDSNAEVFLTELNRMMGVEAVTLGIATALRQPGAGVAASANVVARAKKAGTALSGLFAKGGAKKIVDSTTARLVARSVPPAGVATAVNATFGGGEQSVESASAEVMAAAGAEIGFAGASMVTALSAAPAPMRPFVWLSGMLAKRPNMARAVGTVAGSFIGASQEYDYDSPLDYLELGAIVGVPGVFSLNRARASDQVLHRFSDSINGRMPANLDFNDVMQSASKPGAIVRLQEAMKKAAAGEGGFNPFKIITDEDALYVQALNRNKAIPVSSATFAVELLGSDEAIRQAIKATGGVPGPLSRNINKRLQEQARHLMPLEITDDVVKELSSVMPKLQVVFNDLNSATRNRLMSFLGPDVFPSLRTSTGAFRKQADILAAKVEQQTAVHRIMDQSPEEFNAFLSGLRTAGKIAQKTGLPESTLDPKALRVADDMAEQISVQRFKFIEEAFKGEYFRQNILMSAAKPLSEATGETVSEGVLKGAWVFDGASMFKYIKTNEKHLKNIYGPETTAAFKDLASLIDYGQHLEQEAVTGVRQAGNRLMSFYTHRLAFKLTTGGVTQGPGTGFGGLLLGMAGLQTVTETADFLISASRMSQLAIEEPEVVSNLWKAVQSGDLVRQQNAVRGVLSRVAPDNDSAQDNESPF